MPSSVSWKKRQSVGRSELGQALPGASRPLPSRSFHFGSGLKIAEIWL